MPEERGSKEKKALIYQNPAVMLILFVALALLIIDQSTKFTVLKNFQPGNSLPVIKDIFHISLVFNRGVAFGIFSEVANSVFIWVSIVCVSIILFSFACYKNFFRKKKSTQLFLSLILSGAIGNLVDRIRFGFVIDFLDFRIWPVFNIADASITIGTILIISQTLKRKY